MIIELTSDIIRKRGKKVFVLEIDWVNPNTEKLFYLEPEDVTWDCADDIGKPILLFQTSGEAEAALEALKEEYSFSIRRGTVKPATLSY